MRWALSAAACWMLGCGPGPAAGGEASGAGSDGGASGDSSVSDTAGSGPTMPTSSSTNSASQTTTTTTSEPIREPMSGTFEGVVHLYSDDGVDLCEPQVFACPSYHWRIWGCNNVYLRAQGTLSPIEPPPIFGGCDWELQIDQLLEVRPCAPGDCPASSCENVGAWCQPVSCDPILNDCPDADGRCVLYSHADPLRPDGTACIPAAAEPKQLGETCRMNGGTPEDADDCDAGLLCWSDDPAATTGQCVAICDPTDPAGCGSQCVPCNLPNIGLCLDSCVDCETDGFC